MVQGFARGRRGPRGESILRFSLARSPWRQYLAFLGSGDEIGVGDPEFAGDAGLAETAGGERRLEPILQPFCLKGFGEDVIPTSVFVMPLFGNGSGRTSANTPSAFFIPEKETVFFGVAVGLLAGIQFQQGDNRPDTYGHPLGSDEPVIQAEGPQATGISDMAF